MVQSCARGLSTIDILGYSGLTNVKKSTEMELVIKGIKKNNRKKIIVSPSLWFKSKFTGEPIDDEGTVDPAPEGIEERRALQDTSGETTTDSSTTPTEEGTTTEETNSGENETTAEDANPNSIVEETPIHESSTFSNLFKDSSSDQFRKAGYVDAMVPNLSFSIITIFIGGFWYFTTSVFCGGKITVRSNCLMRFLVYGGERCIWISLLLSTLELSIFSTNNLLHPDFTHIGNIISFVAACLAFIFVVSFPLIIFRIANRGYDILWSPDYYNRYAFFFCEFKLDKTVKTLFLI